MPLAPGDNLGPDEIVAPIGEGGMGEVYKAATPGSTAKESLYRNGPPAYQVALRRFPPMDRECYSTAIDPFGWPTARAVANANHSRTAD